jgi:hypothetical protein
MDAKDQPLHQHTEDELVARYVALREGPARLAVLDELARRGVEWAAGMAEFEREQAASNNLARRHITDLPAVRMHRMDSDEAIEEAARVRHTVRLDRPGMWILRSKSSPCKVHPRPQEDPPGNV